MTVLGPATEHDPRKVVVMGTQWKVIVLETDSEDESLAQQLKVCPDARHAFIR